MSNQSLGLGLNTKTRAPKIITEVSKWEGQNTHAILCSAVRFGQGSSLGWQACTDFLFCREEQIEYFDDI